MFPETQSKPSSTPLIRVGESSIDKRRKMPSNQSNICRPTRGIRKAFSPVNRTRPPPPSDTPHSISDSDYGVVEFTKEEVEALMNERLKTKNMYNIKEKCEMMAEYIRNLKHCIKWFQPLEGNYVVEQDNKIWLLEISEKKCSEMENLMKEKEQEFESREICPRGVS